MCVTKHALQCIVIHSFVPVWRIQTVVPADCPPGHTITMITNAFSYRDIHSSRFGGSRLWYRRIVPRVIPSQVNSFFIVDKPIVIG